MRPCLLYVFHLIFISLFCSLLFILFFFLLTLFHRSIWSFITDCLGCFSLHPLSFLIRSLYVCFPFIFFRFCSSDFVFFLFPVLTNISSISVPFFLFFSPVSRQYFALVFLCNLLAIYWSYQLSGLLFVGLICRSCLCVLVCLQTLCGVVERKDATHC